MEIGTACWGFGRLPTSWVAVGGGLRFCLVHPCSQASCGEIPIALMWKVSSRARTARRACCRCGVHVADGFEPPAECGYYCQRGRVGWGALAGWPLWPTRSLRRERVWFAAEEATSTIVRCVGDWSICSEGARRAWQRGLSSSAGSCVAIPCSNCVVVLQQQHGLWWQVLPWSAVVTAPSSWAALLGAAARHLLERHLPWRFSTTGPRSTAVHVIADGCFVLSGLCHGPF